MPESESLKLTLDRVEPYFQKEIAPRLKAGESLAISAHGNSLRALVKLLLGVSDDEIVNLEIPTGNPLLFNIEDGTTKPTSVAYLDKDRAQPIPPLP